MSITQHIKNWLFYYPPSTYDFYIDEEEPFFIEFKRKAPIRFYLVKAFHSKLISSITHKLELKYWWVTYRFNPKHRYHVIDTGLKPGFTDLDNRFHYALIKQCTEWLEKYSMSATIAQDEANNARNWYQKLRNINLPYDKHAAAIKELNDSLARNTVGEKTHKIYSDLLEAYEFFKKYSYEFVASEHYVGEGYLYTKVDIDDVIKHDENTAKHCLSFFNALPYLWN